MNDEENISAQALAEVASGASAGVSAEASAGVSAKAPVEVTPWLSSQVSSELTPQAPIEILPQAPIEVLVEELIQASSNQILENPAHIPDETPGERKAKHIRKRNPLRDVMEFIVIILMAVIITMLLRAFVIDNYEIPTGSMEPTIEINDRIFAEKLSYRFASPAPGDIVTFRDPVVKGRVLIKRCIAVGGQTINLKDGKVYVNGIELDEPYVHGKETLPLTGDLKISYPYRVPEGMIWVMGDNRTNSTDSRSFGPIPESELIGKALFRFLPLSRFGKIE